MSWPQWQGAVQPSVGALPVVNPAPAVINPATAAASGTMPVGMQYTPEQWQQMQQQNWQQWAQWQQQYQQWHQQYGAEYQKTLTAMATAPATAGTPAAVPSVPPMPLTSAPPPLPQETKPPLPPEEPPAIIPAQPNKTNFQGYTSVPSTQVPAPSYTTAISDQSNFNKSAANTKPQMWKSQPNLNNPPPNLSNPPPNLTNLPHNLSNPPPNLMNMSVQKPESNRQEFGVKRPYNAQQQEYYDPKRNKFEQSWQTQSTPQPVAAPISSNEVLSESEKKFMKQFTEWEAQFNKWKEQNQGHPDKTQYKEYEKKWEAWRNQLLERKEQMRRRRLGLPDLKPTVVKAPNQPSTQQQTQPSVQPAIQPSIQPPAQQASQPSFPPAMGKPPVQQPNQPSFAPNMSKPPPTINNEPLQFKQKPPAFSFPIEMVERDDENPFLKSSSSSGIPGLDLVDETDTKASLNKKHDDSAALEKEKFEAAFHRKGADLDALSKNINSILGDQKLLSMLSMVTQNKSNLNVGGKTSDVAPLLHSDMNLSDHGSNIDDVSRSSFNQDTDTKPPYGRDKWNNNFDFLQTKPPNFSGNYMDGGNSRRDNDAPFNNPSDPFNQQTSRGGYDRFQKDPEARLPYKEQDSFKQSNTFGSYSQRNSFKNDDRSNPMMELNDYSQYDCDYNEEQMDTYDQPEDIVEPFTNEAFTGGSSGPKNDNFRKEGNFHKDNFMGDTDLRKPPFNRGPNDFSDNFNKRGNDQQTDNFNKRSNQFGNDNFNRSDNFNRPNDFMENSNTNRNTKNNFGNHSTDYMDNNARRKDNFSFNEDQRSNFSRNQSDYNEDFDSYNRGGDDYGNDYDESEPYMEDDQGYGNQKSTRGSRWQERSDDFYMEEPPYAHDDSEMPVPIVSEEPPAIDDILIIEKVIDYEHKSKKPTVAEVSIEAPHLFDYRHKAVNRIPLPERPRWLSETLRSVPEFEPCIGRPALFPPFSRYTTVERFDYRSGPSFGRYDEYDTYNRRPYDNARFGNDRRNTEDRYEEDYDRGRRLDNREDNRGADDRVPENRGFDNRGFDNRSFDNRGPDRSFDNRGPDKRNFDSRGPDNRGFDNRGPDNRGFENRGFGRGSDNKDCDYDYRRNRDIPTKNSEISKIVTTTRTTSNAISIDDVLNPPGRFKRPSRIVIILRGPPGSGKTFLARLIKDREVENGGSAPRILSLDDYFMVEQEKEIVEDGKNTKIKEMVYEYEECMEASYRTSLLKSFKKTITDGYFPFIIVDNVNDKTKYFSEMWSFAKQNGFEVYICQLELDVQVCSKRNVHHRSEKQIEQIVAGWDATPQHFSTVDATNLLQAASIPEVEMEEIDSPNDNFEEEENEEQACRSKWDNFECSIDNLAKLDGINKPLRPAGTMEDYLQLDEWKPTICKPGQKRVRWADLEERKEQEKMRAIGFVVGQTDWDRMLDPTQGGSALTKTKYIERVRNY